MQGLLLIIIKNLLNHDTWNIKPRDNRFLNLDRDHVTLWKAVRYLDRFSETGRSHRATLIAYRHSENGLLEFAVRFRIAMRHVFFGLEHQTSVRPGGNQVVEHSGYRTKSRKGTILYPSHVLPSCLAAFHVYRFAHVASSKRKKKKARAVCRRRRHGRIFVSVTKILLFQNADRKVILSDFTTFRNTMESSMRGCGCTLGSDSGIA